MERARVDLTVLIPALNEEKTIREVIERCQAILLKTQIVVINDGSTDGTAEILRSFGDKIDVVTNVFPSGKGSAIRSALGLIKGEVTIIQDADLEYFPEEIERLVTPILNRQTNVVYGTRFADGLPKGMAIPNKIVNILLALSVRILFGEKITDEATCYKAVRSSILLSLDLQCTRFEFCPEVTAKVLRLHEKIMEVPIQYVPRSKHDGKKIRWYDAPEAFWTLLKYRFWQPNDRGQI